MANVDKATLGPIVDRLAQMAHDAAIDHDRTRLRDILLHNFALALSEERPKERLVLNDSGVAWKVAGLIYARAQDDWFDEGRCHIAPMVIAAALDAGAQDVGAAVAAGYAVQMPLAAAYGAEAHLRGLRPTSLFGVAGATAAAAVGLGLTVSQTSTAIALSLGAGAGVTQCMLEETDEWRLDLLRATRAGVESARLAAQGAVGARLAFEGDKGWCQAVFGDNAGGKLRHLLNTRTFSLSDVGLKPFPASGAGFATIDAALKAHAKLNGAKPDRLQLRVDPAAWFVPGSESKGPFATALGPALSLPNLMASSYLYGTIVSHTSQDWGANIKELMELVEAGPSADLAAQRATLEITVSGQTYAFSGNGDTLLKRFGVSAGETAEKYARRFGTPVENIAKLFALTETPSISAKSFLGIIDGQGSE